MSFCQSHLSGKCDLKWVFLFIKLLYILLPAAAHFDGDLNPPLLLMKPSMSEFIMKFRNHQTESNSKAFLTMFRSRNNLFLFVLLLKPSQNVSRETAIFFLQVCKGFHTIAQDCLQDNCIY